MEKVLLSIKNYDLSRTFTSILRDDFHVEIVENEADGVNALLENEYACLVLDSSENDSVLFKYLIESKKISAQPVCMVVDPSDIQKELNLFSKNCAEIFNLPIDPIVVRKRIQNVITIFKLQHNVEEYEKKLITDPLTGLYNKDGFQINVRKMIKNKVSGAFIMCDMDGLKYINDNFSHQVGDTVIRNVGTQLKHTMPKEAIIAHISGDEFCVYIPKITDHNQLIPIIQNFQKEVISKVLLPDLSRPVTASIGVSIFPDSATSFESLSSKADHALLFVKNHGKNGYKFHAPRDDREELLKGRQECTSIPIDLMLKKRENEDIQIWLKFGEFRIVYLTYKRYINESVKANLCQLNIIDLANRENPDSKKISVINDKVAAFIKESEYAGIFSWYSINQLLILSIDEDTIPKGVDKLKKELEAELSALQVDIELCFN